MSVAIDSPVHSSSSSSDSDDFASILDTDLLDTELDSDSDSQNDADHKFNRRKIEHVDTVDEVRIEAMTEASSSKGACEHSVVVYNLCVQCGAIVEGTGVSLPYIHKNIRMNQDEISRLRESDMRAVKMRTCFSSK